jgi:hypothetical protein
MFFDNTKTALISAKQKTNLKKSDNQNETSCDSSENTTILIDEQIDFWPKPDLIIVVLNLPLMPHRNNKHATIRDYKDCALFLHQI